MTTIIVPDLSGATDVDIVEVFVAVGDTVAEGDALIALETDKASMEIEADKAGKIVALHLNEGDTCNEGDLIVELEAAGATESAPEPAPAPAVEAAPAAAPAPAAVPAPASVSVEQVLIPDLSGATDVDIIEVLVAAGDQISEGDSLIALETDKASMEVPAPKSGKVLSVAVSEGGVCNEGDLLLELEVGASASPAASAADAATSPAPAASVAEPAPAPAVSGGVEDVLVPDLSGASDVDVIEVMVSAGDQINEGDSLIALETDKASMEVPAPKSGTVKEVKIAEGGTCNEGDLILVLEVQGAAPAPAAAPASAPAPAAQAPAPAKPAAAPAAPQAAASKLSAAELEKKNKTVHAGPAVRALAREFGVDLSS